MKLTLNILIGILIVFILLILGFIFAYLLGYNIENKVFEGNTALISGILIGFSALLASTTVMKSINNTNLNEIKKERRDLYDRRLSVYHTYYPLEEKLQRANIEISEMVDFRNSLIDAEFIFAGDIKLWNDKIFKDVYSLIEIIRKNESIERALKGERKSSPYSSDYQMGNPLELENELVEINRKRFNLATKIMKDIIEVRELIKNELKLI